MTLDIDVSLKPLPGYRLIEHIGSGGYGEVWRAEAPGGLTKAIKFVFGLHHEKRAANELRALDRIRSVRHPFLLSLERIEVVDGRLLIVTELADGSVKDRFDTCRQQGMNGIPREELLAYLRDAADALDFMTQAHALQHLDIKPENLLLLAGRVKVADFGLVKDVRQSEGSLVGGMTPLYAAPELFRSGPSVHSDQYSLAIVFQEMLTGTTPFAGGNAAELTLQHLNDEPELRPLSVGDRYVVSRALSKNSEHRYATCREFVDALLTAGAPDGRAGEVAGDHSRSVVRSSTPGDHKEFVPTSLLEGNDSPWNATPRDLLIELPPSAGEVIDLAAIELQNETISRRPTVVLGIGGAAIRAISHLRRMIADEYGGDLNMPWLQFLALDTDPRALSAASQRDSGGLSASEALNLPLRRPQHYRDRSQQLLQWLSRRWLYNIPRSMRTEGLRPLGRLALADHARQTFQRLRGAMMQALEAPPVGDSHSGVDGTLRPNAARVFVVASISGGTGSGMAIDVAYAVRAIVNQIQLSEFEIIGLMLHSTGRDPRQSELARVNAYSWLAEFDHFQRAETAYAGDASCGLPSHAAGVPPFDHTYLIHLGDNLDDVEFDQSAESIAEYLKLNLLTSAGAFFDVWRRDRRHESCCEELDQRRILRSFGIYRRSRLPGELCDAFERAVSRRVLDRWLQNERGADAGNTCSANDPAQNEIGRDDSSAVPGAVQLIQRLQLDAGGIAANARMLVELQLGGDAAKFLSTWTDKQKSTRDAGQLAQLQAIDRIFGAADVAGIDRRKLTLLGQSVSAIVQPLEEKLRTEVSRWLVNRMDDCDGRVPAARKAAEWLDQHCCQTEAELRRLEESVVRKLADMRQTVRAERDDALRNDLQRETIDGPLNWVYFQLRLDELAISAARRSMRVIKSDAKDINDKLILLGREITQLGHAIGRDNTLHDTDTPRDTTDMASVGMAAQLQSRLSELAAQVDARLQADYLNQHGGLLATILQGGRPRAQLCAKLLELSRQTVHQAMMELSAHDATLRGAGDKWQRDLRSALATATPQLLAHGGTRRIFAAVPSSADRADVVEKLGAPVTAVASSDQSLTLCVEASDLSLAHIALELVERRRDRVEFAARVHTRNDIAWSPLIAACAGSGSATPMGINGHSTEAQQDTSKTLVM